MARPIVVNDTTLPHGTPYCLSQQETPLHYSCCLPLITSTCINSQMDCYSLHCKKEGGEGGREGREEQRGRERVVRRRGGERKRTGTDRERERSGRGGGGDRPTDR